MRVYLAGPDVFLPDPQTQFRRMKQICARHNLHAISPLDPLPDGDPPDWAALPEALRIARRNETHIIGCDAMIANLTPFRGPSADAGTIFEIGFMRALGRPIHAWTNNPHPFTTRTRTFTNTHARDPDNMLIEDFNEPTPLTDNLMITHAITTSGGHITTAAPPHSTRWTDLAAFETCVARCVG